jgi:hypothetical protein
MRILIVIVVTLTACAPVAEPAPLQSATSAPRSPAAPTESALTATPGPTTTPVAPPAAQMDSPVVLASMPFPIAATFTLARAPIAPGNEDAARLGVRRYLEGLDRYRDQGDFLPAHGEFGKAVAAALVESRTPGVKRTFILDSLKIEALYKKPWGTQALADVRVTILDRAVGGSVPDQRESGLLRMGGDDRRFSVIDAWDDAGGRWFNGRIADNAAGLRHSVEDAVGIYLRTESWLAGMPVETHFNGADATAFQKARGAYIATFDRATTLQRTFADVTGAIERYDTFAEIADGLATVRVVASVITSDAAGRTQRQAVTRRVKVFFGNWAPEVVDEEVTPGVWRSGGDLALLEIDVNRA